MDHGVRIGEQAAILSGIEVGLGSLLHAYHLPFSGHALALNQSFLLSSYARTESETSKDPWVPWKVSSIAALLKSLSPAGKKLTPMLAIACQGLLFSLGTVLGGNTALGCLLGGLLSGTWSFLQPFFLYWIFYGSSGMQVLDFYAKVAERWFSVAPHQLLTAIGILFVVKILLSGAFSFLAWETRGNFYHTWLKKLLRKKNEPVVHHPLNAATGAFKDLLNPLFLCSLFFTSIFLFFAENNSANSLWLLLRPIAIAFILFWLVRVLPIEKIPSTSFQVALRRIRGVNT